MSQADSIPPQHHQAASAFVPLPVRHGDLLRVLGPGPQEAGLAVEPLVKLDEPLGVVQAFVGGLCTPAGRLVRPVEIALLLDATAIAPSQQVPVSAVLRTLHGLPGLHQRLPAPAGFELVREALVENQRIGPLLYCRKRHTIFTARSPHTAQPLRAVPVDESDRAAQEAGPTLPDGLLVWDGPDRDGGGVSVYGGRGGTTRHGPAESLEQMALDQGRVIARVCELRETDPVAAAEIAGEHTCCECPERERCYPPGAGYAYAADRLVVVSAAEGPLAVLPLGEWRLDEVARVIGGLEFAEVLGEREGADSEYDDWRRRRAAAFASAGPARLLAGETDGRELLEIARLKLALIADVLEQLSAGWTACGRPHSCWNDETVRVAWHKPATTPAMGWGFQPLLRKIGLQPNAPVETTDNLPLAYPPAFSDTSLLPPEAADAARYFDEPRAANVFVKSARPDEGGAQVQVLLEDLGVPWALFCPGDALHVSDEGWRAVLSPMGQRNPDDGQGLPFAGRVIGDAAGFNVGEQLAGCSCRWYPRFGEALDLHAVGVLMLETLLAHDQRSRVSFREAFVGEREELTRACLAVGLEQREEPARRRIGERCQSDAPAALWSRRNLLHRRDDRNRVRLDAFPAALWQATIGWGLRAATAIPGFSFCARRDQAAPRVSGELVLPLVELRGLIALLDDLLFGRATPGEAVRDALRSPGR